MNEALNRWAEPESENDRLVRRKVMRQAFIFSPLATIMIAGVGLALVNIFLLGNSGYLVMLTFCGTLSFLLGYQALGFLRDINARCVVKEGEVGKKWTKGNLFFFLMPSHYIAVQGTIFSIHRSDYIGLLEDDLVRVRHFPHSLTVESIERYDMIEARYISPRERDSTS